MGKWSDGFFWGMATNEIFNMFGNNRDDNNESMLGEPLPIGDFSFVFMIIVMITLVIKLIIKGFNFIASLPVMQTQAISIIGNIIGILFGIMVVGGIYASKREERHLIVHWITLYPLAYFLGYVAAEAILTFGTDTMKALFPFTGYWKSVPFSFVYLGLCELLFGRILRKDHLERLQRRKEII